MREGNANISHKYYINLGLPVHSLHVMNVNWWNWLTSLPNFLPLPVTHQGLVKCLISYPVFFRGKIYLRKHNLDSRTWDAYLTWYMKMWHNNAIAISKMEWCKRTQHWRNLTPFINLRNTHWGHVWYKVWG